jgi:hypothetical protein
MRRTQLALVAVLIAAIAPPGAGGASSSGTYRGKAKSLVGDFRYGDVTVKRRGTRVTRVKIEAVTATCPFGTTNRTIVFNPRDTAIKILSGSNRIRGGRMAVTYLPDKTVEDQKTTLRVRFRGSRATGTFSETDICVDKGKFTARR